MTEKWYRELNKLAQELDSFYDIAYSSDDEEYSKNKAIKLRIVELVLTANCKPGDLLIDKALTLLMDNSGCQYDVQILMEILPPLVDSGLIAQEELSDYIESSSVGRWL